MPFTLFLLLILTFCCHSLTTTTFEIDESTQKSSLAAISILTERLQHELQRMEEDPRRSLLIQYHKLSNQLGQLDHTEAIKYQNESYYAAVYHLSEQEINAIIASYRDYTSKFLHYYARIRLKVELGQYNPFDLFQVIYENQDYFWKVETQLKPKTW